MSAADRREELEAYVWRLFARRSKFPPGQLVASILAAADKYATSLAAEALDRYGEAAAFEVRASGALSHRLTTAVANGGRKDRQ